MMETGENKPKEPAPKLSRWWIGGPLLGLLLVISAMLGREAWQDHQFEKERTETPPHVVEDLKLKLLWIPAGTFTMGTNDEAEWQKSLKQKYNEVKPSGWDEWKVKEVPVTAPETVVTLSSGFYLGETEVTQAQWEAVMGSNRSYHKGPNRPVEEVRWEESVEFCRKLTLRERAAGRIGAKQVFRLPTEAEWEFACRAGSQSGWSFGNDKTLLGEFAWFEDNSGGETHEVGTKRANSWGLRDMNGNVWEWCSDWFGVYPGGMVKDPTGTTTGSDRVARGGSWDNAAGFCGSASRGMMGRGVQSDFIGFRLALSPSL